MRRLIREIKTLLFYTIVIIGLIVMLPILGLLRAALAYPYGTLWLVILGSIFFIALVIKLKQSGGKYIDEHGYVFLTKENDLEHRHLAKQILNRNLGPHEVVHHINGQKTDNRIENLCVMNRVKHEMFHSWLSWKRKKSGYYPSIDYQRKHLEENYGGVLLDSYTAPHNEPQFATPTRRPFKFRVNVEASRPQSSDNSLYEELRKERLRIARERNIPAYAIFKNFTLEEMAETMPETDEKMLKISGMSQEKLHEYGDYFFTVIRKYKRANINR